MAGTGIGALLFIWVVGALLGGTDTPAVHGTAQHVPLATTRASSPPATGRLPVRGGVTSSASSSVPKPPPTTTTTTVAPTTSPPPLGPCPDSAIKLTVTSAQPSYAVGQRPALTLHIVNGGPVACTRDVSRQYRSILVLSGDGTNRLWSSSDCYSVTTNEIHLLQPGQVLTYGVTWAGRTSASGCPGRRATVPAGTYQLVGQLGSLTGPPTTLTLT
jgi:hypothetical protein